MHETLQIWHEIVATKDPARLADIIAADCVFISPVLHTPQQGGEVTCLYLTGAAQVLNGDDGFHYVKEVVDGRYAVLEFVTEIDGLTINGVDIMTFNEVGKICEFKVMLRPMKAVHMVQQKMAEMLQQLSA